MSCRNHLICSRIEFVMWISSIVAWNLRGNLSCRYRLSPHRIRHMDIVSRHIAIVYCHIVIVYCRIDVVTCSSSHSTTFFFFFLFLNSYFNREATSAKAVLQLCPLQHTQTPYKIQHNLWTINNNYLILHTNQLIHN